MNHKYIVLTRELYGHWGQGSTLAEAEANCLKTGATAKHLTHAKRYVFESIMPFAPNSREATESEADCWVGQDGGVYWVRCDRFSDHVGARCGDPAQAIYQFSLGFES